MSENTRDSQSERHLRAMDTDAQNYERYAIVGLESGGLLLYDRTTPAAWIKTDAAIDLADVE